MKCSFTALFLAPLLAFSATASAAELRVCFEDKEQFPNYLGNSNVIDPVKPGMSVEIVQMAAAEVKLELKLVRMPWPRCLSSMQQGEIHGVFNSSFKEDRLAMGAYPMKDGKPDSARRLTTISYSLYRRAGAEVAWDGKTFVNLSGAIGAPTGYSIVDDLKKMGVTVDTAAPDTSANFKKLQAGRIAGVAAQDVTADQLLRDAAYAGVEKVKPPLVTKDYFIMFAHQYIAANPGMAEKIWDAVARLRDAKAEELARKYAE